MCEPGRGGYQAMTSAEKLAEKETFVAQEYDRKRSENLNKALEAALELIRALPSRGPQVIDCSAILTETGVSKQTFYTAVVQQWSKFKLVDHENGKYLVERK